MPLARKLRLLVSLAVLTFGTLNLLIVGWMAYRAQTREQDRRIHFIANLIAQRAEQPILFDDLVSLDQLVRQSTSIDQDISYLMINDARGNPLVHTFPVAVPDWVRRRLQQVPHSAASIRRDEKGHRYREIQEPILGGDFGRVVVGMSQASIDQQVAGMLSMVALFVSVLLLIGLAAAHFVAARVTAPIERIASGVKDFELDGDPLELSIRTEDEIGMIARSIETMARRLQQIYRKERTRERDLMRVERLAALGTLAAGIAHEVNNPLAGIKNAAQRLARHRADPERVEDYSTLIGGAVDRVEQIVKRMLSLTSSEPVEISAIRLAEAIDGAVELAQPRLATGHVQLDNLVGDDLPLVKADPDKLGQIILNLLLNAADAVKHGSVHQIVIRAENSSPGQVIAEVEDSGEGVPEELAERIFDPFFTTKGARSGTGLGLAVSWSMASEMGARLELVNPGRMGAIFRLTLQEAEEEQCPPAS